MLEACRSSSGFRSSFARAASPRTSLEAVQGFKKACKSFAFNGTRKMQAVERNLSRKIYTNHQKMQIAARRLARRPMWAKGIRSLTILPSTSAASSPTRQLAVPSSQPDDEWRRVTGVSATLCVSSAPRLSQIPCELPTFAVEHESWR